MPQMLFPDGRIYDTGNMSEQDIQTAYDNIQKRFAPVAPPEPEQGTLSRAGDLLELGTRNVAAKGARGIAQIADMSFDDRFDNAEDYLESFAQGQDNEASKIRGIKPLQEAEGIGDVFSSGASYLVQSIPEMAPIFVGMKAGAIAGSPFGPIGATVGAGIGLAIGASLPFLGENTEQFKKTQNRAPDKDEALNLLGTSIIQGGLNALIFKLIPFKGSPKITTNMIKKGLAGTGLEGSTEFAQELGTILAANNFDTSVLSDPDVVYRLKESLLAGGFVGGAIGVGTSPFTTEAAPPAPQVRRDAELEQAATDFKDGQPQPPAQPAQLTDETVVVPRLTSQESPEPDSRVEDVVTVRDGVPTAEQRIMTGQQEPFLVGQADATLDANEQAQQTNSEMVMQIAREALDAGLDPLEALGSAETTRRIEDALEGELEQDVALGQTPVAQEKQNLSRLKNKELIEWAEQNVNTDEIIGNIVKSQLSVTVKAQQIRKRLADLNVRSTTALEQGQQVGKPILRKDSDVDPEGRITRTTTEGTVSDVDPSGQARMGRRTDTAEGLRIRDEVGPVVTPALREALRMRGGEASIRTGDNQSTQDSSTTPVTSQTLKYEGALNYLTGRLQMLEKSGSQGKKLARAVKRQVMDDTSMNANDVVAGFLAADAVVNTLGGKGPKGGVELTFLKTLTNEKGNELHGEKSYSDNAKGRTQAVMRLALGSTDAQGNYVQDSAYRIAETANHEAFHFLQDFFVEHSPSDAKLLRSVYKLKDGKVNYKALPSTVRNLWKKYAPNQHQQALNGSLDIMSKPSEFQAMTYEFYQRAKSTGDASPLAGAFGKYFDFISGFLPRLANSVRGMGFQTVEDLYTRTSEGTTGRNLDGKTLTPRQSLTEESSRIDTKLSNDITKLLKEPDAEQSIRNDSKKYMSDVQIIDNDSDENIASITTINLKTVLKKSRPLNFNYFTEETQESVVVDFFERVFRGEIEFDPTGLQYDDFGETMETEFEYAKAGRRGSPREAAEYFVGQFDKGNYRVMRDAVTGLEVVSFSYPIENEQEPSVSYLLYPDGRLSPPHFDENSMTPYRLENELFNFFTPEFTSNKIAGLRSYAQKKDPYFLGFENEEQLKGRTDVWDIGFSVDGLYETTNESDARTALETFARATASFRVILDEIINRGLKVDAIIFAGTDSKKHSIYKSMVRNKGFMSLFPELGSAVDVRGPNRATVLPTKFQKPTQGELFSEESIRIDRVQDISNIALSQENDAVSNRFNLDEGMRRLSSIDILYNKTFNPELPEKDKAVGRDGKKRDAGRNIAEAARMLHNRALEILNEPITSSNPETDEMIARVMAAEIVAARENNPDTSAADWYTRSVDAAIAEVSKLYPEISSDPEHRSAFSLALAITSQGIVVDRNSKLGLGAYEFWRNNGRFPEFGEGKSSPAILKNFRNANVVMDVFKNSRVNVPFHEFLSQQFTVKELKQKLEDFGVKVGKGGVGLSGEGVNTEVYGSYMFGPKIGQGFYQNLTGNYDPITIDLWFMRSWGRMTGTLVGNENAFQNNLNDLRISMRNEGLEYDEELFGTDEQYTFDKISEANNIGEEFYTANKEAIDNKELQKSPMMKSAAAALVNGVKPIDTPRGGPQRKWIRSVVKRAQSILEGQGQSLTSADMQAILWYPEKDLYSKLTTGQQETRLNQSYEDAFKEIVNETGLRTLDGRGRGANDVRETIEAGDAKSRRSTPRTTSGKEESIRFSTADYRTTDGMKATLADPTVQGIAGKTYSFIRRFASQEGRKNLRESFVNEFVHGLAPLARRELELNYRETGDRRYKPFAQGAFKITELAQQMSGRMQMFNEIGAPKLNEDGSVGIVEGTQGLKKIFEPIGQGEKYAKFQMFVYAQRAQRLKSEGRENLMTDAQIAEGLQYGVENPEFQQVFNQYKSFNESVMQFLKDTGSVDEETKQRLIGTADYVPFYRIIEEEQYTEGLFGQVRRGNENAQNSTSAFDNPDARIKDVLRKLKGGEEKIGDLYQNVFANTQAIVSAGLRNVATQRTVKLVEDLAADGFYDEAVKPKRISKSDAVNNNNHFTLREDGKSVYFDVGSDAELLTAMRTFTPVQMQGFLKTMQNIGRFFRNAITITPSFMEANLIRGDMAGVVTVDAPLRPMIDTVIGLKNALTDADTILEMKTIGGFGGYTFGESSTDFAKKMKRFYRRHEGYTIVDTPQKLTDMFLNSLDRVNNLGEATELATREAIYRRMTEAGSDKGDAAYEALNLINYSRRGNPNGAASQTLAMLLPLVPFLNARIQGLYRTGTAFKGEANAKRTALKGMALMGLSLGLYSLSSKEDDWDKEPLHRKLNYYIIYSDDKKFLIPKPFEIGAIFSTMPEVFLDGIRKKDGEYVAEAVTQVFLNNLSFNPIPQAIKPIIEVATNQDFFRGREIESLGVRGLPTEMRSYSTTSEFAKMIGNITGSLGISPIEAEKLISGYTGSMGSLFLAGTDSILGMTGQVPTRPAGVFGDSITAKAAGALGITRFVKDRPADPSNQYLSDFYELKREADEVVRGINRLREEGNFEDAMEMRKENRSLIAVRKQLNVKYRQLNELNDKIQGVKRSGSTPEEKKRRVDLLIKRRNSIVRDMSRLKARIRG